MKKSIMTVLCLITISLISVSGQNQNFVAAMRNALAEMNAVFDREPDLKSYQEVASHFERIASTEPDQWLPAYYAAYCYINMSYTAPGLKEKDKWLDQAAQYLSAAGKVIDKPSDEIFTLEANLFSARLAADPMNRWQEYGEKVSASMEKARQLNPDNPRIYLLEGSGLFYTPKEYGGGKEAARPYLEKAREKFATFKPDAELHPDWGRSLVSYLLSQ